MLKIYAEHNHYVAIMTLIMEEDGPKVYLNMEPERLGAGVVHRTIVTRAGNQRVLFAYLTGRPTTREERVYIARNLCLPIATLMPPRMCPN